MDKIFSREATSSGHQAGSLSHSIFCLRRKQGANRAEAASEAASVKKKYVK
jgi:hypothetical protein